MYSALELDLELKLVEELLVEATIILKLLFLSK